MYNLAEFSLTDMTACSAALRTIGAGSPDMDETAKRLVRYFYEHLISGPTDGSACALVRFFTTQPYGDLPADYQDCARSVQGAESVSSDVKCLTLLATAGDQLEWNQTRHSQRYKSIPLISTEFVAQFPMFSQLFTQLGIQLPLPQGNHSGLLLDAKEHTFNVFHVPEALGSPFVPVQKEFVIPYGIRSVIGFGGVLPSGNLFVVILFSKVRLSHQTAELFKTLALSAKLALLPVDTEPKGRKLAGSRPPNDRQPNYSGAQIAALEQLLAVHEQTVIAHATERRHAEEALDDSEARLRAVVGSTKDVVLFVDRDGIIKSWNEAAETLFGYSFHEAYGKPGRMIIETGLEEVIQQVADGASVNSILQATGATYLSSGRKKNGHTFPLELSLASWKTKHMGFFLATIRDMTERRRIEAALEQSESRFRNLIEHAPDLIFTLSPTGLITSLNPVFETMTKWPRSEWIGKQFGALVHRDDMTTAHDVLNYIVDTQFPLTCVLRLSASDERVLIGEFIGTPLMEDGRVIGVLGFARDITERKAVEHALKDSEERLRSIVQSTKDAIVSLDRMGIVVFWNQGAEQLFGYAQAEMLGHPLTRIIPERFREQHMRGLRHATLQDQVTGGSVESVALKKDGSEFPIEFSLASWKTRTGQFFTGIIRDISERKWSEDAIHALVQGTASVIGEAFFPVFVRQLAVALEAPYAFVTELIPGTTSHLRILAGWEKGAWCVPFEYDATIAPCGTVLRDRKAFYAEAVHEMFPEDSYLTERGVTSFLGVAMLNSAGQVIGHVCVMGTRPLKNDRQAARILNVFAARAAAELERLHATVALRLSEARQALILNSLPIALYTAQASSDFRATWVSDNVDRLTGFPSCAFVGTPDFWLSRVHPEDRRGVLADLGRGRATRMVSTEYRWQIADGSYRWYLDNAVYTYDAEGNPKELIGAWTDITRVKHAEEGLRETEERFKIFMDRNPAVIFMKDEQGRHVYANLEFERILGMQAGDWLGKTDDVLWPPQISAQFRQHDRDVLETGAVLDIIETSVDLSGEEQYWRVVKFPLKDRSGTRHLCGIAMNVTSRKRAEEAVRQADERFRSIFENAVEGIFQTTPEGRYLTVNPALARLYGYASQQDLLDTITDIGRQVYVDPLRRKFFKELMEQQSAVTGFESQVIRKDGKVIWISESVRAIRDRRGQLVAYEGSVEDITARKEAEYALRESEERLRLSLSATHLGIWDWNILTGDIIWSDTVPPIFGLARGAFAGTYQAYIELIYPDDREIVHNAITRSVEEGVEYALEHRVQWPDGTIRWVACKGDVLRNEEGAVQRMLGTVQDVTERKRGEAELQSVLTRLRTLSGRLEVIREEERGRIARELHDEFGVGLTCIKIDLSRLTTLIGGTVGLEKARLIDEKIHSMTEFIDTTIGGVQRIVSELRPAILDDLGLVAAIEWQAQDFQRRTGIICSSDIEDEHLHVDSDRATVIFRICQEALTNVARHASARTVLIRLAKREPFVTLVVEDNGVGIAPEKIADPQSLGLLGMRERAEQFGGTVTIVGRPRQGTVVTLQLPYSPEASSVGGLC